MNKTNLEQLIDENEQLKSEQQLLNEQLEKLNIKLQESESFKSHFLSNISNEIINPFTSILGISQNILTLKGSDIGQIHLMASLIHSEAFDLDFQLRNIFSAAKIESGENILELVNINIQDFTNEIIESLRIKTERRALNFTINYSFDNESFVTDADKLRMILINLIMNAIIFSKEKNSIKINTELSSKGFIFEINNKGILISEKDTKVIFDRFVKLDDNINSLNQGHGLGLSIIKDYVELLGGSIKFESNKKDGTTFYLNLPPIKNTEKEFLMEDEDIFSTDDSEIF